MIDLLAMEKMYTCTKFIRSVISPLQSGTFFPHEMNLVHVYIFSIASKSIMCVSLAKAQFASFGGASRRLVLSFRLSLLLPRDACTHALLLYHTRPSVCFALSWISVSLVGNLVQLVWPYVACSLMQHRRAVPLMRPRNA
jgi:hypothetical protein